MNTRRELPCAMSIDAWVVNECPMFAHACIRMPSGGSVCPVPMAKADAAAKDAACSVNHIWALEYELRWGVFMNIRIVH